MTVPRIKFADGSGILGPDSGDRLGRVMYEGGLAGGTNINLPWLVYDYSNLSACNGAIFFTGFPFTLFDPAGGLLTWNNTTKVLSNPGTVTRDILVIGFKGSTIPAGAVGIVVRNANGEIIIDNVNPNLEIIRSGSMSCTGGQVSTLPEEAALPNVFTFLRWPQSVALCRGNARQLLVDTSCTVDYRIARVNPVYAPISGGNPAICLRRGSDGLVLFDGKRSYARLRTLVPFENFSVINNGGTSSASFFQHNSIPLTAFFRVERGYILGTRILFIQRVTDTQWASFPADTAGILTGDQRNALGLVSTSSYPGPVLGVTVVANP